LFSLILGVVVPHLPFVLWVVDVTFIFVVPADPTGSTTMLSTTIPSGRIPSRGRNNMTSPRTGSASAPVNHDLSFYRPPRALLSTPLALQQRHSLSAVPPLLMGQLLHSSSSSLTCATSLKESSLHEDVPRTNKKRVMSVATASLYMNKARNAMKENDQMVYLDGPQIYSCAHCRTHLTSHDDIVSKSFHGRHGTCCTQIVAVPAVTPLWLTMIVLFLRACMSFSSSSSSSSRPCLSL
jgi:hypothetical protein